MTNVAIVGAAVTSCGEHLQADRYGSTVSPSHAHDCGTRARATEVTTVGGALPRNTDAGFNAKRHTPGATDVAQCVELVAYVRGQAVDHVGGARVALAHNVGGPTAVAAVTLLEGPVGNGD